MVRERMIEDGHKRRGQGRPCYKIAASGELSERCAPGFKGMNLRAKDRTRALVEELLPVSMHGLLDRRCIREK